MKTITERKISLEVSFFFFRCSFQMHPTNSANPRCKAKQALNEYKYTLSKTKKKL